MAIPPSRFCPVSSSLVGRSVNPLFCVMFPCFLSPRLILSQSLSLHSDILLALLGDASFSHRSDVLLAPLELSARCAGDTLLSLRSEECLRRCPRVSYNTLVEECSLRSTRRNFRSARTFFSLRSGVASLRILAPLGRFSRCARESLRSAFSLRSGH